MSAPEHINQIMPGVMGDIEQRMQRRRARHDHRGRVLNAVRDFNQGRRQRRTHARRVGGLYDTFFEKK